ncbi:MAG TPA: tyrosine-type recombinase/integrase, partial [bacterium]|nr:tyrosine-type recombinase/integrase [bacterium]
MADAGEDMRAPFKARPLTEVVDSFLLTKRVSNCTPATLKVYQWWLVKLARDVPDTASLDSLAVTTFLSRLRERGLGPSSIHQAWRTLRTFTRWMLAMGLLRQNPLASLTLRTPKTLPSVPSEADVQALLRACPPNSFNGRRAPAIVLVFADTGIRQSELRHLLIEHVDLNARTIVIRAGKGQRDRVVPFSPTTARALRLWLMLHPMAYPESPMFAAKTGNPLQARNAVHLLHRLSVAAKLRR